MPQDCWRGWGTKEWPLLGTPWIEINGFLWFASWALPYLTPPRPWKPMDLACPSGSRYFFRSFYISLISYQYVYNIVTQGSNCTKKKIIIIIKKQYINASIQITLYCSGEDPPDTVNHNVGIQCNSRFLLDSIAGGIEFRRSSAPPATGQDRKGAVHREACKALDWCWYTGLQLFSVVEEGHREGVVSTLLPSHMIPLRLIEYFQVRPIFLTSY